MTKFEVLHQCEALAQNAFSTSGSPTATSSLLSTTCVTLNWDASLEENCSLALRVLC